MIPIAGNATIRVIRSSCARMVSDNNPDIGVCTLLVRRVRIVIYYSNWLNYTVIIDFFQANPVKKCGSFSSPGSGHLQRENQSNFDLAFCEEIDYF
jgi:hypothetical protein